MILKVELISEFSCHQILSAFMHTYINTHSDIKYCIILYE